MEFARVYIYAEGETNPAMQLGKKVAEMIQEDREQEDEILEHLRIYLPQYEHKEYEINTTFNGIKLKGFLDGFDPPPKIRLGEYKTGRLWTQSMADKTEQLHWYALLVHLYFGIRPEEIPMVLTWMPTEWEVGNVIQPTGEIQNFETQRTTRDCLSIGKKIIKVYNDIGEFTAKEYKALGI